MIHADVSPPATNSQQQPSPPWPPPASPATLVSLSLYGHLSHCAAASLVAPCSRWLVVALPPILTCRHLSCRTGWLSLCHLSLCAAVSLFATSLIALDPLNPSKKRIDLLGGPSSINQMRWRRTKGLMRGARGPFLPAAAMVVIFVGPDRERITNRQLI